jgi:hypothetical protein
VTIPEELYRIWQAACGLTNDIAIEAEMRPIGDRNPWYAAAEDGRRLCAAIESIARNEAREG